MTGNASPGEPPTDGATSPDGTVAGTMDVEDLLKLTTFLKLLPGVKPRVARQLLDDLFSEAIQEGKTDFLLGAERVSFDEANAMFRTNAWGTDHVSPVGATVLLRLYGAGLLPMTRARPGTIPEEATRYAGSQAALEEQAAERRARRQAAARARAAQLADPAGIAEDEFSIELLNALFFQHHGPGEATLVVGGIPVHKTLHWFASNSGASRDPRVTYTWASPGHGRRSLVKPSLYEDNRHNDPERNWGLPE